MRVGLVEVGLLERLQLEASLMSPAVPVVGQVVGQTAGQGPDLLRRTARLPATDWLRLHHHPSQLLFGF